MLENSSYSLFELVKQADIIVKSVMLILAAASIFSWTLIFDKIFRFFILKLKTDRYEEMFNHAKSMDDIIKLSKRKITHPFAKILNMIVEELLLSNVKSIILTDNENRKNSLKERLYNVSQVSIDKVMLRLEKGLGFLAIIGSTAPFIGLFGTVWGIMNSFQNIAISKNTSLTVVAPGIAEALLATAIGLFVAIPAVFFYNINSNILNSFCDKMSSFSKVVINRLSRSIDLEIATRKEKNNYNN